MEWITGQDGNEVDIGECPHCTVCCCVPHCVVSVSTVLFIVSVPTVLFIVSVPHCVVYCTYYSLLVFPLCC